MARKKSPSKTAVRREPMREFSRSLPLSLLRARKAVMRHFGPSLRQHGLTEQQWRILRALASVDTIEVTELARVAFLLGPSLSRSLRDLGARRRLEPVAPSSEAIYAAMTRRYGARNLAELQDMLTALETSLSEPAVGDSENA